MKLSRCTLGTKTQVKFEDGCGMNMCLDIDTCGGVAAVILPHMASSFVSYRRLSDIRFQRCGFGGTRITHSHGSATVL